MSSIQKDVAKFEKAVKERVVALVAVHGVDTARKIIIREHNRATKERAKLACALGLKLLAA